jgi:hypothetical protein
MVSISGRPPNSRRCVRHSHSTTPAANTSARASRGRPYSCSGAMYATLPLSSPVRVCCTLSALWATPKSPSLMSPTYEIKRFEGVTSRCTTLSGRPCSSTISCAVARPASTSEITCRLNHTGIRSLRFTEWRSSTDRSVPATYSIAINSSPSSSAPSSNTCTMLRWWTRAAIFASSMNISAIAFCWARCGRIRLMTTIFSKPATPPRRARYTSAIPPAPIRSSSSYLPYGRGKGPGVAVTSGKVGSI